MSRRLWIRHPAGTLTQPVDASCSDRQRPGQSGHSKTVSVLLSGAPKHLPCCSSGFESDWSYREPCRGAMDPKGKAYGKCTCCLCGQQCELCFLSCRYKQMHPEAKTAGGKKTNGLTLKQRVMQDEFQKRLDMCKHVADQLQFTPHSARFGASSKFISFQGTGRRLGA